MCILLDRDCWSIHTVQHSMWANNHLRQRKLIFWRIWNGAGNQCLFIDVDKAMKPGASLQKLPTVSLKSNLNSVQGDI